MTEADVNWDKVMSYIADDLRRRLARHPAVGAAMTFAEGEKFANDTAASLAYDIHKMVDPGYDT